jgi:CMP-N-acetylneuraminic acid synthetase
METMSNMLSAIVPMKGHSERVPNKNVRSFNGKPLFHWILATLEESSVVDEIIVDTDSEEIAEGAQKEFDVRVIERPEHLRGDEVPMNDILLHDVTEIDSECFLQTHCTNPLLRPETISAAYEAFQASENADSLFSLTPHQVRLWDTDVEPINHERDKLLPTQKLEPVYEENSNIYLFTQSSIEERENRIGFEPMTFEMEPIEAVDIDEPIDFKMAEWLHRERYGEEPSFSEVKNAES